MREREKEKKREKREREKETGGTWLNEAEERKAVAVASRSFYVA